MIITNAIVCDVNGERKVDVKIEEGVVVEIGSNLQGDNLFDAQGAHLLPGLIDLNVRLKDDQLNAKSVENLRDDASKGGITQIVLNPDMSPAMDNEIVLEFLQHHQYSDNGAQIDTMLNATNESGALSNIAILLKKGALAPHMSTNLDNNLVMRIFEYAKMMDVTVLVQAEDSSLSQSGVMAEGAVATRLGLGGIPALAEVTQVARLIEFARQYDVKVLFKSIAAPRSIEMITEAKGEGVKVRCEVSLHHLLLNDTQCEDFNTRAKLSPPLAIAKDQELLLSALGSGQIDVLTVLHHPNSLVNKEVAFFDAAFGSEAIEDALSLYYTKLVKSGTLSWSELLKFCVKNPASTVGLDRGEIKVGMGADLILFDTTKSYSIENTQSLYNQEVLNGILRRF